MNIVLDCTIEKLPEVLMQAQQVGLMAGHYNYMITNLVSCARLKNFALLFFVTQHVLFIPTKIS